MRELPGLLLPGLVNTHCHTPMLLLRGMGGDLPLLRWLHEVMWPAEGRLTASDVRTGMVSGCVELLRTGTTTSVEMYFFTDAVIDAVLAVGSRVLLTPGVIAAPGWDRLGSWEAMRNAISRRIDRDGLRFGPFDRVELGYGPHAAYTLPASALRSVAEHARERGALLHLHLAETLEEDAALRAEHGSVPALLDALGVFGGRVLAAHGVHLSDADIGLLAARGAAVAHCPGSNAKLAAGVARVSGAAPGGGPGRAGDRRSGVGRRPRPVVPGPPRRALRPGDQRGRGGADGPELLLMATREGAAAIGRDDLGPSNRAAGPTWCTSTWPTRRSSTRPTTASCCRTWSGRRGARLVRDVWVAGEQVLADGEPTRRGPRGRHPGAAEVAARLHTLVRESRRRGVRGAVRVRASPARLGVRVPRFSVRCQRVPVSASRGEAAA